MLRGTVRFPHPERDRRRLTLGHQRRQRPRDRRRHARVPVFGMNMRRDHDKPVYVGQPWRVVLRDLELDADSVLRRAGQPSNLFDGDGSWDLRRRLLRPVRRNRSRGRQRRRRGSGRRGGVGRAVRPGLLRCDLHTGSHDRPHPPRRAHAARGPVPARRRCHDRGDDRPVPMQAPPRRSEGARPVTARLHRGAGAPRDPARDRAETRHRHRPRRRPRRVCRVLRVRRARW